MELVPTPRVLARIHAAFQLRALAKDAVIFESHDFEVDSETLESLARQVSTWDELPQAVLAANPLALAFMSPEAFAWFLPAYMITSVERYAETDTLTGSLLARLTPPDEADALEYAALVEQMRELDLELIEEPPTKSLDVDAAVLQQFHDWVAVLTQDERAAVRDYLHHVDAEHGADFPAFGPKQALDRYWEHAAKLPG